MKVLYFGTVCDLANYNELLKNSRKKASVAPIVFEMGILEGLKANGVELDVFSFPMIPDVLHSKLLAWGRKKEQLRCGYEATWIPTINFVGIKQITRFISSKKMLDEWLKLHKDEQCMVLIYSICPFVAPNIVKLCRKYGKKCVAIVPDLPENMYMNQKSNFIKRFFTHAYLKPACDVQNEFDGYVFLSEFMKEKIDSKSPYEVIEGIVDRKIFNEPTPDKSGARAIMYAGRLHEKYGLKNLIEAYMRIEQKDVELWLFGSGSFEENIIEYAKKCPMIKFFGQVTRDKVLEYEQKATLLVNCRNPNDEYVKYSFPSKTLEYMASGTPLLTTSLPCIPDEYKDFIFTVESNDIDELVASIDCIMNIDKTEMAEFGSKAKRFVLENKNSKVQSRKILCLINNIFENSAKGFI